MAVSLTATDYSGVGTGSTATYATGIYANASDQIKVYVNGLLKTLGDDYSLNGLGSSTGVDVIGSFVSGATIYIERVTPITQLVDTQNNETILEDVLDGEFDKLTMIAQEIGDRANRSVLFPKGEPGQTLPPAASRAAKLFTFGSFGEILLTTASTLAIGLILDAMGTSASAAPSQRAVTEAVQRRGVDIVSMGADPTGVEDCTAALTAALAISNELWVPAGRYRVNAKFKYIFAPSATGPSDNKNTIKRISINGAGRDSAVFYFPNSSGFEFECSSFQHVVDLRGFSITTGQAGGGTTGLKITNRFAYFGEYTARHYIDVGMRGDDGFGAVFYWSTCLDLFNASNVDLGPCGLDGPVLGATASTYGTGVRIASSATPGIGTSTEPGYGTLYNLTGLKGRFLGRAIEIGDGVQSFALGPGTDLLNGYDGIYVAAGGTEVRQISVIGAQISCYGNAYQADTAVSACVFAANYIGVAPGKNGLVFATDAGAANGGGTTITGNTFVAMNAGASDGIYVGTSFQPITITGNTFVGLACGVELAAAAQLVLIGPNRYVNCTNSIIDSSTSGNIIDPVNNVGNGVGFGNSVVQPTSKATNITFHSPSGQITTNDAALGAGAKESFLMTNRYVRATDVVTVSCANGNYRAWTAGASHGERAIYIENITGGSLSDAVVINFVVQKGSQV